MGVCFTRDTMNHDDMQCKSSPAHPSRRGTPEVTIYDRMRRHSTSRLNSFYSRRKDVHRFAGTTDCRASSPVSIPIVPTSTPDPMYNAQCRPPRNHARSMTSPILSPLAPSPTSPTFHDAMQHRFVMSHVESKHTRQTQVLSQHSVNLDDRLMSNSPPRTVLQFMQHTHTIAA